MPASAIAPDANFNCFGEVCSSFSKSISHLLSETKKIFSRIISAIFKLTFLVCNFLWNKILLPIAMCGLNILGFLIDKFLFGCPVLRQYFDHGLIKCDIHDRWRRWVSINLGWDIYNTMKGIPSNIFGILGAGIGVLTILTHLITSIYYNVRNYYHLLSHHGVFGQINPLKDERNNVVKIIFGIFTAPLVLLITSITNTVDVILTSIMQFIKHFVLSCWYNFQVSANFILGEHGVYGEKIGYEDKKRHIITRIIFGVLSSPLVGLISLFSNIIDLVCTTIKHFCLSFWRNLKCTDNIVLGEHGIYKIKFPYEDDRNIFVKIIFGVLSAPFVGVIALGSNMFDLACTGIKLFFKHVGLSCWYNLQFSYNLLLNKHGIYGRRLDYDDKQRNKAIRIIFGIISLPLVAIAALISNAIDLLCSSIKHFFLSFWRNLRCIDNIILGKHGIYKVKFPYNDNRNIFVKIIFGILSAPLVGLIALGSNTFDLACTGIKLFVKHVGLSIWYNLQVSYNLLLNKHGIYGRRVEYDDTQRNKAIRFIFGLMTIPIVALAAMISNLIDIFCTTIKHFCLSSWRNFRSIDNIVLGEHGIYGKKYPYLDNRNIIVKGFFGALSAPIILTLACASNTFDIACTSTKLFAKNFGLSVWYNIQVGYNLVLNKHGIYGRRVDYDDKQRYLATRLIFGLLSLPIVIAAVLISNLIDLVCTTIKHFQISLMINLNNTYNLILGEHGLFSDLTTHKEDNRNVIVKGVFGVLSAPFVLCAAIISNITDLACTACEHIGFSAERNLPPICNFLGEKGIFGKRGIYEDDRNIILRGVCGLLTAPIVFLAAAFINTVDLIGTYFKNWRQTIKEPAFVITGFVAGALLAIPIFMLRKTLSGLYNVLFRPFVDYYTGKPFNTPRFYRSILNVATGGGLSACSKIFKACSGYSHRFGLPGKYKNYNNLEQITDFEFETEKIFKRAIDKAIKEENNSGVFRPFVRTFFGMKNESEKLLKEIHDAYRSYARSLKKEYQPTEVNVYSIYSFFGSSTQYTRIENKYKLSKEKREQDLWEDVKKAITPEPVGMI